MESNGKSNQQLKLTALLILLLAFVGVAGGLDLYPPLQARAANQVLNGPLGHYYNKMGGAKHASLLYKDMLTKRPADFPAPATLWNTSGYQMVYTGGLGNATTSLRHQVFLPPLSSNGTPPSTVKYYNPKSYPAEWTQDQYNAWDRYTGIVTNPSDNKKEFQVVGTAIPYRWFHTTYVNHRVQIIAQVQNKTKGTTKYVSTEVAEGFTGVMIALYAQNTKADWSIGHGNNENRELSGKCNKPAVFTEFEYTNQMI